MSNFAREGELVLLLVCNGMDAAKLSAVIENMKTQSKAVGTHKRRELFWNGYGAILSKVGGATGEVAGFLTYRAGEDATDGTAEFVAFTKKQHHALSQGSLELMGKKQKPLEEPESKAWVIAYSEAEAAEALRDITSGEACVYATTTAVYVSTRLKRRLCKSTGTCKTLKDLEKLCADLPPTLQSVDWTRTAPPTLNAYNLSVAGPGWNSGLLATLPATVGRCESGSPSEIYDAFLARRSAHYGAEAERLIDQMIADTNKGEAKPIVSASSMKEAQIARNNSADAATTYCRHTHEKIAAAAANISLRSIRIIIIMTTRRRRKNNNTLVPATAAMIRREKHLQKRLPHTLPSASFVASGLMKRVFVHESKRVFIDNIRTDGDVELFVVTGNIEGSKFADFGGIVFELFYRVDLSVFG